MTEDTISQRLSDLEKRVFKVESLLGVINDMAPELLQDLINSGALSQGSVTHREILAPKIRQLLQENRYGELEKFLDEYSRRVAAIK